MRTNEVQPERFHKNLVAVGHIFTGRFLGGQWGLMANYCLPCELNLFMGEPAHIGHCCSFFSQDHGRLVGFSISELKVQHKESNFILA